MSFIIVPQIVTSDTIMIWVAAIGEKVREMEISIDYREIANKTAKFDEESLSTSEWRMWRTRQVLDGDKRGGGIPEEQNSVIYYQRVTIGTRKPLKPGTKYLFKVMFAAPGTTIPTRRLVGSMQDFSRRKYLYVKKIETDQWDKAVATATTLPTKLPTLTDPKPFTVMLGSCFYRPGDPHGLAGKVFYEIPPKSQPNLKILCGDQVYLDNPWEETTLNLLWTLRSKEHLRQLFVKKYLQKWTQMAPMKDGDKWATGGFNVLLRHGANYFASDDHEFWNNAPNWGAVASAITFLLRQKRFLFQQGADLFRVFQSPTPWTTFDVPPISFCIADTRVNRNVGRLRFMENDDLDAIGHWISNLKGPGVLSLGQPVLAKKSTVFGYFFDRGLADYGSKFKYLKQIISQSKYSIVLLTGDVHFGRYAECELRKPMPGETTVPKFVEVISSPMRIVDGFWGKGKINGYEDAYDTFGTGIIESMELARHHNHFVTLEFTQDTLGVVSMGVWEWPIPDKKHDLARKGRLRKTVELT